MQALSVWTAPVGTLGRILGETASRVDLLRPRRAELERRAAETEACPSLSESLRAATVTVLAEVKRSSPSKGPINPGLDAVAQAIAYEAGGARGISVLTEPRHFGGSAADLEAIHAAVKLPLLRKDFHVDVLQLLEARALGACAVLLIARALSPAALAALSAEAHGIGLEVLVEVRDEAELDRALATEAQLIGVNNRNLETLQVDMATSERLIPRIPPSRIAIAESGVGGPADVERAAATGADAVLVGSVLSAAADPADAVRALTTIPRSPR